MNTQTINVNQLAERLALIKGAQPIAFVSLTDADARKTGNPYSQILKLSKVRAFTGADYENSVNRQLDREGKGQLEFHAKERSWGERISSALVQNKGELYLVTQILGTSKPIYLAKRGRLLQVVSKEAIADFLPAKRKAVNQGTEKEVVYRNYKLSSIVSIALGGQRFRIRQPLPI